MKIKVMTKEQKKLIDDVNKLFDEVHKMYVNGEINHNDLVSVQVHLWRVRRIIRGFDVDMR